MSVSSTGGLKGTKLARFDLIPVGPLRKLAEHYGRGAEKYADNQWRKGYEWSKSYAALTRHLTQFWGGEDIDEETGSPHLAAVAWHAFALLEFMETHPGFDDRHSGSYSPNVHAQLEQVSRERDELLSQLKNMETRYMQLGLGK